jgi:hypothetical protein
LDLASRRQGKSVRLVWQSGQTDFVQNLPKDPEHLKTLSTSEQKKSWHNIDFLAQKLFSAAHRVKPVRPVWETGHTGFCLDSREEHSLREKLNAFTNDLPIRSTDQSETLGMDWEGNHNPKNHEGFPQISPIKSPRARSRKQPKKITKRGIQKSPPRTTGNNTSKPSGTTPNHLYMPQRFIQGLACRPIIQPSQQDLTMKLSS